MYNARQLKRIKLKENMVYYKNCPVHSALDLHDYVNSW